MIKFVGNISDYGNGLCVVRSWKIRHARSSRGETSGFQMYYQRLIATRISLTFACVCWSCCCIRLGLYIWYCTYEDARHVCIIHVYLYVTRYARFYGGSHVTHTRTAHRKRLSIDVDGTSAGVPLCKRKKTRRRVTAALTLLSAFNDRESPANRQNGSINPRRDPFDANGTPVTRTFLQCKMERY